MYCRNCGARIPDDSKFCGECGAKTTGAAEPGASELFAAGYPVNDAYAGTYTAPAPVRPAKKKKRWILPVVIICAVILGLAIALLILRGQSVVYKYETVSVDGAALGGGDLGGFLGGTLAETVVDSMMEGLYVEIGFDKTITLFSKDLGYYKTELGELDADSSDVEFTVDMDFISLETEGITLMFRRVTDKGEIGIYKQLLEAAVANGEEMDLSGLLE